MSEQAHTDAEAADAGPAWTRVHPLSPWVRSWLAILIVGFTVLRDLIEQTVGALFGAGRKAERGPVEEFDLVFAAAFLGVALLAAVVGFGLSWWFTRFRLEDEQIALREGWIFRKQRHMKYDRIQAVDLQHPLLPRLLGLAKVQVEAVDGGDTALELQFLKRSEAERVRREILDRAAGRERDEATTGAAADETSPEAAASEAPTVADAPEVHGTEAGVASRPGQGSLGSRVRSRLLLEDEGTRMLSVPTGRLIGSILCSGTVLGTVLTLAVVAGVFLLGVWLLPDVGWLQGAWQEVFLGLGAGALPLAFGLASAAWKELNQGWNFTVFHTEDGLRLTYGLADSVSQTIPPGRVQGVTVKQPLWWRPFGWHRVTVIVAGYGGDDDGKRSVALPVGPFEDVLRVLAVVLPEPGVEDGRELMTLAMRGSGTDGGFRHVPRRARGYFHWHTWRRNGFTATDTLLIARSGRIGRRFTAVQHERIEAVEIDQGPVQKRLRVASLNVCVAGRLLPVTAADDLDEDEVRALFERETAIAAVARRLADRNRWMRPEELERFERQLETMRRTAAEVAAQRGPSGDALVGTSTGPGQDPETARSTHT